MKAIIAALTLLCSASALAAGAITPPEPAGPRDCLHLMPRLMSSMGDLGTTALAFTVTEQGRVTDVTVQRSAGDIRLDDASERCVKEWTYKPAMQDGKPVAATWTATINWRRGRRSNSSLNIPETRSGYRP